MSARIKLCENQICLAAKSRWSLSCPTVKLYTYERTFQASYLLLLRFRSSTCVCVWRSQIPLCYITLYSSHKLASLRIQIGNSQFDFVCKIELRPQSFFSFFLIFFLFSFFYFFRVCSSVGCN